MYDCSTELRLLISTSDTMCDCSTGLRLLISTSDTMYDCSRELRLLISTLRALCFNINWSKVEGP
jgi:hypothetical protein